MPMSPRMKAKKGRFGLLGLPPLVTITSPVNGYTVAASAGSPLSSADVDVTATATDDFGSPLDISSTIVWTSSIDGAVGSGGSPDRLRLSVGTHVITASASDQVGSPARTGSDSITVTVT